MVILYACFSTAKAPALIGLPLIQEERLLFKFTGSSSLVSSIIRKRDFDNNSKTGITRITPPKANI